MSIFTKDETGSEQNRPFANHSKHLNCHCCYLFDILHGIKFQTLRQQLRMWLVVGLGKLQRVYFISAMILHLLKLMGDGKQSQPAPRRKDG